MLATNMRFDFIKCRVTLCSRADTADIRAAYTESLRKDFRDYAIRLAINENREGMGEEVGFIGDMQIHHIRPISLGGTNAFHNLALVDPELHVEIHRILSAQTKGMAHGEKRHIQVPIVSGPIWRM